jgi:hypothetical protein
VDIADNALPRQYLIIMSTHTSSPNNAFTTLFCQVVQLVLQIALPVVATILFLGSSRVNNDQLIIYLFILFEMKTDGQPLEIYLRKWLLITYSNFARGRTKEFLV